MRQDATQAHKPSVQSSTELPAYRHYDSACALLAKITMRHKFLRPAASPRHAHYATLHLQKLDPQVRKLLELTWEAWMDAGIDVTKLKGGAVGVYVGCCGSDCATGWYRDIHSMVCI